MSYLVFCFGVYTGLYMRKFDFDQRSIRKIVQSTRATKEEIKSSFNRVIWNKREQVHFNVDREDKTRFETFYKRFGEGFDYCTNAILTKGLYQVYEDIKDNVQNSNSE